MSLFTHIDEKNNPTMVDITSKESSEREATALASLFLPKELEKYFVDGDLKCKKGPVFQTAIIAGTQAVKKTWDVVPFCHPLLINSIKIFIERVSKNEVEIKCTVKTFGKTGIEIEALNGVQVAALTVYDMCKAITKNIEIRNVKLIEKKGGKSDFSSI